MKYINNWDIIDNEYKLKIISEKLETITQFSLHTSYLLEELESNMERKIIIYFKKLLINKIIFF